MMDGAAVDTSTMLVLAAIALAEGTGRVPAGSVMLRRFLSGAWQIEEPAGPGNRLRLVHWWPPWTDTLVVPPRSNEAVPLSQADLVARIAATATVRTAARVIGAVTLTLLVVGVPAGFGLAGAIGGLTVLGGVAAGQITLGLLGWRGLASLRAARRERMRLLTASLNPFTAPALASRLLAAACAGATPATVARTLLSPERWASWFRPRAYDAGVAQNLDEELGKDLEAADDAIAQVLAERPKMARNGRWCPRCAATYHAGATACADCNIDLLEASEGVYPTAARSRPAQSLS
jgi:hypothetical protein